MANFREFEINGRLIAYVNVDSVSFVTEVEGGCEIHFIGDAETLFVPLEPHKVRIALLNPHL